MIKRIRKIAAVLVILLVTLVVYGYASGSSDGEVDLFEPAKTTVRLWYSDEALADYYNEKAVGFNETHSDVRVEPALVSGLELLEEISKASLEGENYPDLYVITNDTLEKAQLAGLTTEVSGTFLNTVRFPQVALNAVTYDGRFVAYPFYYETSTLLYNKTYLERLARSELGYETAEETGSVYGSAGTQEDEPDAADGKNGEDTDAADGETGEDTDAADGGGTGEDTDEAGGTQETDASSGDTGEDSPPVVFQAPDIPEEEVAERVAHMIPSSIADILSFASEYTLPGEVEGVFKWDVSDIFYNYFFVGNYMDAGGPAGDSITSLDLYNSEMVSCLKTYQMLNTYFAIDAAETDYDKIVDEFIEGKMVFTVATSDAIARIRAAQDEGICAFDYGAASIPSLNDYYDTRTMSVTNCVVINGYSDHAAEAAEFAEYMIASTDESLFVKTGKLPALAGLTYEDESLQVFYDVYTESVPLPKMIETSNLWMRMEIMLTQIWNGANCNQALKDMSEAIMKQVVGRHYEEMLLPEPDMIAVTEEGNRD